MDPNAESGSRGLKKGQMLNNHNIILLFSDYYNILPIFQLTSLIFLKIVLRNSLDPDSDCWLDPDSMNMDPKHWEKVMLLVKHFFFQLEMRNDPETGLPVRKTIKFGTNCDLSDEKKWKPQIQVSCLALVLQLPAGFRFKTESINVSRGEPVVIRNLWQKTRQKDMQTVYLIKNC